MSDQEITIRCPDCGGQLVERENTVNQSRFMSCSNYPSSRHTEAVPAYLEIKRAGGLSLPGFE